MSNDTDIYTSSSTQNFALVNKAVLRIASLKNFELYLNGYSIPGIVTDNVTSPTQFSNLSLVPNKAMFEDLNCTFLVDSNFRNWRVLFRWITGISRPDSYKQYAERVTDYCDGILHCFDSNNNQCMIVQFKNLVPRSLGALNFDPRVVDSTTLNCSVSFAYDQYDILLPEDNDFHTNIELAY